MSLDNGKRKQKLIDRDGCFCHYCGKALVPYNGEYEPNSWTVDHIHALANGGRDNMDNVVLACRRCNARKGTKSYTEPENDC